MYQPIRRTRELRSTEPQAPSPTNQEKIASFGPRRKKGGNPPRADKRERKARLKILEYLCGWGQEVGLDMASRLHPKPKRAPKINTTKR
jgi:hypothetical protein